MALMNADEIDALLASDLTDEQLGLSGPGAVATVSVILHRAKVRTVTNPAAAAAKRPLLDIDELLEDDPSDPLATEAVRQANKWKAPRTSDDYKRLPDTERAALDRISKAQELMSCDTEGESPIVQINEDNLLTSLDDDQRKIVDAAMAGQNFFFTGVAGTGKTRTILAIVARKSLGGVLVSVVANTGVAAAQIGGMTIHAWAGIGIGDPPYSTSKIEARERIMGTGLLIFDEIGTASHKLLSGIDLLCRDVRKRPDEPFGGIQVIACGDFLQLRPVSKNENANDKQRSAAATRAYLAERAAGSSAIAKRHAFDKLSRAKQALLEDPDQPNLYAFRAKAWAHIQQHVYVLKRIYRQQSDLAFMEVLAEARRGRLSEKSAKILRGRIMGMVEGVSLMPDQTFPSDYTVLYAKRADVDAYNKVKLASLTNDAGVTFVAVDKVDHEVFRSKLATFPLPEEVTLKVGARVMLRKNLHRNLANGMCGWVVGYTQVFAVDKSTKTSKNVPILRPIEGCVFDRALIEKHEQAPHPYGYKLPFNYTAVILDAGSSTVCPASILSKKLPKDSTELAVTEGHFELASQTRGELMRKSGFYPLPVVRFDTGEYLVAGPVEWSYEEPRRIQTKNENGKVTYRVEKVRLATRIQVPVVLAWSLTVHSCQGLTLKRVCIDLGKSIFEAGQAYVALTRVESLSGLLLRDFVVSSIRADPEALRFHDQINKLDELVYLPKPTPDSLPSRVPTIVSNDNEDMEDNFVDDFVEN